jgi:hypothetical protein
MTFAKVSKQLAALGIVIGRYRVGNDYRINFKDGKEATAYYTDDLDDAYRTGITMAKNKPVPPNIGGTNERVVFRLIWMPCCHAMFCWVNPRLPNYCPECGKTVFALLKWGNPENILLVDDNAWLKISKPIPSTLRFVMQDATPENVPYAGESNAS